MQAELAALKALATEHGKLDDAKTKQLQELEKQIALRQQDADKAVAQAQAGRLAAESAKVEAEAYKDNSGRVKELGEAYEQARLKLEQVRAAKAAGKATTEEVTAAETEAGKAARLYRDALSDLVKALEAKNNAQQADAALATSALQLQLAQEKSYEASAKAMGNEVAVIASKIRQKEIEIKIIEAKVQAQIAEAEGSIAVARAKMTEMEATGKPDAVKKAELESTIKIAQARINQAKAEGKKIDTAKFPWAASGRAIANGADYGFTKLIFDAETHRVIGGAIVGPSAGDMIGEVCLAIEMGCDAVDIGKTIHPHPTLGESIGMAAEIAHGSCTDVPPAKKK